MPLSKTSVTRANQLRLARDHVGLTQVELARLARVSPFTVCRYEQNGYSPVTDEYIRVLVGLQIARAVNRKRKAGA